MTSWFVLLRLVFAEVIVVLVPIILIWLWFTNARENAILGFFTVVVSLVASYALGLVHSHPAPYMVSTTLISGPATNSFPSQHTTVMFAMCWPLFFRDRRRLAGLFLVAGFLVGIARVSVGFHYSIDLLGAIIASVVGGIVVEYRKETLLSLLHHYLPINSAKFIDRRDH